MTDPQKFDEFVPRRCICGTAKVSASPTETLRHLLSVRSADEHSNCTYRQTWTITFGKSGLRRRPEILDAFLDAWQSSRHEQETSGRSETESWMKLFKETSAFAHRMRNEVLFKRDLIEIKGRRIV